MRTNNITRILTALFSVLAISTALLTSSAAAHQPHHSTKHANRHHHHHHRRHRRHHHRHHALATSANSVAVASPAALAATQPTSYPSATISGRTYYVSPTGSDQNSGTSPSQAWKTVNQANKASVNLKPGDAVLFQGGATYSDDSLQPGWGDALAGSTSAPIVFGSYGSGKASIRRGVWLHNSSNLVIENLDVGPQGEISGTGNQITVQGCSIHDIVPGQVTPGQSEEAINVIGSDWVIRGNAINHTGDSGMLIRGDHFQITGNVIANTGLDPAVTYGDHGIYLKATQSTVTGNTIYNFHNDGVSIRYRDSIVTNNLIANGQFGLAWFQYDSTAGTSHWTGNRIVGDTVAGIYVSPSDPVGGNTRESFVITSNQIAKPSGGSSSWVGIALKPTSGTYTVDSNQIG